ncbi:hypothetical protein [Octadecabacter sp. SW4]|uniref:hypothetical protein n=1 Tax=Octadecabacter sp. SW4 TaxID=2602067 RepID=UPI00155B2113|nr:hypothetical protein [Octadecabacter sp. SW4]
MRGYVFSASKVAGYMSRANAGASVMPARFAVITMKCPYASFSEPEKSRDQPGL